MKNGTVTLKNSMRGKAYKDIYFSRLHVKRAERSRNAVPITDVFKKQLAQKHRLFYKVCRDCGARNPSSAYRCRKCRGDNLRWKKRELGAK